MFHTMRLQMRIPGADSIEFMIRKKQLFQRHGFIPDVSILTLPFLIAMLIRVRLIGLRELLPYGIIPAYTGNTQLPQLPEMVVEDYPRIHGEHITANSSGPGSAGSSPYTRRTRCVRRGG